MSLIRLRGSLLVQRDPRQEHHSLNVHGDFVTFMQSGEEVALHVGVLAHMISVYVTDKAIPTDTPVSDLIVQLHGRCDCGAQLKFEVAE